MKFGKEFTIHLEQTLPQWRDKYLCYKLLKKLLKNIPFPIAGAPPPPSLLDLHEWFVGILNEEVEKFNDFYVDKEEDFIIRFQALKEIIDRVKEKTTTDGLFISETESSEEMMEIRKDIVSIHGEMVLLKHYSSLNFAGLIKILKKYDKRTGELLSLPFTWLAFQQPFFITEPLSRLVRECEENLEVLFPLEAEVVESTINAQDETHITPLSLGDETVDIFRSILAAITSIQGLKKASSTYNPLSLSYVFGKQDNENTGAVTAENSPCDSLIDGDDENEKAGSPK